MKREDLTALGVADDALDKIMSLHGADIEKHKQTVATLTAERDDLKGRLEEANGKLSGYDPEWKAKAEQAQKDAEAKVAALERRQLLARQTAGLKFSSESARKAFLADLEAKGLPAQEGKLLGFEEFVKDYQAADPGAFAPEIQPPEIVRPAGSAAPADLTKETFAKMGYRERLTLKKTKPDLYEKLTKE